MPDTISPDLEVEKAAVAEFWDRASCGEVYATGESRHAFFESQAEERYRLEPYIASFAKFETGANRDVLEIGVGMGADHLRWAQAGPRSLSGIDLTPRAIAFARERLTLHGLQSRLETGDAERLPFPDESFDIVYSWGVLHHSPDTPRAIREVHRVLRPGGVARIMVYHKRSIVGLMLWTRYALLAGKLGRTLSHIYAAHLESPGTKAYSRDEARSLFKSFRNVETDIELSPGDVLSGAAGQRHGGALLSVARALWPRAVIRRFFKSAGLFLVITAQK